MKNLKWPFQKNEKMITAISPTRAGMEWSTIRLHDQGMDVVEQSSISASEAQEEDASYIAYAQLPDSLRQSLDHACILAISSKEILFQSAIVPTRDEKEISGMSSLFIDKTSPYPLDKLHIDFEYTEYQQSDSSLLIGAIDEVYLNPLYSFIQKSHTLERIDARLLGWLELIPCLDDSSCYQAILIDDGIDQHVVVRDHDHVAQVRSLYVTQEPSDRVEQLIYEINYTFQQLDLNQKPITGLEVWSQDSSAYEGLSKEHSLPLHFHLLDDLPPLSMGLIQRAVCTEKRMNFLPRAWAEEQTQRNIYTTLKRHLVSLTLIWLLVLAILSVVYATRNTALNRIEAQAAQLEPQSQSAIENYKKLATLEKLADRSKSSLECLREVTRLLPDGDIEFISYTFSRSKGVTLRGTAANDDIVYDFLNRISESPLVGKLTNQSLNRRTSKGTTRTLFSCSLTLLLTEEES